MSLNELIVYKLIMIGEMAYKLGHLPHLSFICEKYADHNYGEQICLNWVEFSPEVT